jgi:hypothetical protein
VAVAGAPVKVVDLRRLTFLLFSSREPKITATHLQHVFHNVCSDRIVLVGMGILKL